MDKADVIIVLGCGFKSNKKDIGKESKSRVKKGVRLYKKGLAKKILMSGGEIKKPLSYYMKKYAIKLGVPSKNIYEENKSKNTIRNAIFSKQIVTKNKWKKIILVTSDYHMTRSLFIFKHVFGPGFDISHKKSRTNLFHKIFNKKFIKEEEKYLFTETLFAGIKPGNISKIKKRLHAAKI